jgi:hypothetical protein
MKIRLNHVFGLSAISNDAIVHTYSLLSMLLHFPLHFLFIFLMLTYDAAV